MKYQMEYSSKISKIIKLYKFTLGYKKKNSLEKLKIIKEYRKNLKTNRRKTKRKRKEQKLNNYFLKKIVIKKVKRGIRLTKKMTIEGKNLIKINIDKAIISAVLLKLAIFTRILKNKNKCS